MHKLYVSTAVLIILLFSNPVPAQNKLVIKFGKVTSADFSLPASGYDTSAAAVVIADVGYSSFEGNNHGSFSLKFEHKQRIKILKHSEWMLPPLKYRYMSVMPAMKSRWKI